jgi:protocatechuate 3,4-dioxygenase beta subunit
MHSRTPLWLSVAALTFSALPAVASITGTVINADGAPVSGAKISLYAPETIDARRARLVSKAVVRTPLSTVTTGSSGAFSIDSPKGQSLLDLHIEAEGFAPSATRVVPDEEIGAEPLVAAMLKTGTITANGKPLAGATVVWIGDAEYTVETDASGKYSVPDPEKWANRLMIFHPDYAPLEEFLGPFGSNKKGPDRTLLPGVPVSGRVVGSDGKTPVGKAAVLVDSWPLTVSADDGTFTVAHAPGEWEQVNAATGEGAAARVHATGALTLKLAKAAAISGVVRDARTQLPVAGVEVRIGPTGPRTVVALSGMAFTDAKGNYTLASVTPGLYQINASRPGFSTLPVNIAVTAGQVLQKAIYLNERGRITGTVLDEDKRPVPGARLSAHGGGRNRGMLMIGRGGNAPATAASAPDGRYVLRAVDAGPEIIVDAAKRGLPAAHTADLKLAAGEKKTGVNITIPRGLAFSGKVTDVNGKPLSGVVVDASEFEDGGMPNIRRMMVSIRNGNNAGDDQLVRTGSDGEFSLKLKEGKYDVSFKREGFSTKSLRGQQVVANAKPVEVKLEPGVEIAGHVTRGGAPLEGVNVSAISQDGLSNTQTLPDGSFHLVDLTPGSYMVNVNKMDSFIQTMRSVSAPARDVNVDLPAGGRISGRVVDKNSNQPVTTFQAGVTTSRGGGGVMMMMPPMTRQFTSDDGSFTLENVPPGQTQLVVTAPGYTTGRVSGLNVEDGKPLDSVDVGLDTGVKLVGRVTGPDGAPLSGVTVSEDDMAAPGGRGVMRVNAGVGGGGAMTDPNGEYAIDSLEPGEKTFTFNRAGYLSDQKTVSLSNKETRLDEQLSSGQSAMGQVVTDAGGPVSDATISASSAAEGFGQRVAHSDANGNFQFEGLAPGHYTFTASKHGYAPGVLRDFDISTGAPVRVVMSSGGIITGHVTGLAPSDLATATVTANNTNGNASSPVDSSGNYQIQGAPTGTVRVSARTGQMFGGSGRTTQVVSVQVDPGSTATADLVFKNDTTVSGRVTRGGQPVPNVTVAFMPRSAGVSTRASGSTDSSGGYQLPGLDDGSYSVQVIDLSNTSSISFTTSHDVKGTGTFDIDVTGTGVHGRVTDATTGQPIDGAQVELRSSGAQGFIAGRGTQTDSSGNFSMASVAPGSYTAGVVKAGYGDDPKDVVVGANDVALEFKIAPSNGITLKVVDGRDGRMLVAMATVLDSQGRASDTPPFRTGSPEPLQLTLSPGTYRVTVSANGYAAQTVTLSSPSNPSVALTPGGTLVIHSKSSAPSVRLIDSAGNIYSRGFGQQNYPLNPSPGATTIPYIPGGVYRVEVLDANGNPLNATSVTIVDGGQADVSI